MRRPTRPSRLNNAKRGIQIAVNGTPEQKETFLPKLLSGEHLGGMGMSEPEVGTDVLGMRTTAERHKDGYRINGRSFGSLTGPSTKGKLPATFSGFMPELEAPQGALLFQRSLLKEE